MIEQKPLLRFDHREIAVIFSLFVFVSLLMFTVGILVGKGIATAHYESSALVTPAELKSLADQRAAETDIAGTSVSTDELQVRPSKPNAAKTGRTALAPSDEKPKKPLQMVPKNARLSNLAGSGLQEPGSTQNADALMKNPKIRSLVDDNGAPAKRKPAAIPRTIPTSFADGKFTVQVASYPTETDARERVDSLKKLGFPYAYFSAKELGDKPNTWYRVWLGYYPDYDSARVSGEILQERGEVKNYLVRRTDTSS